MSLFPPWLIISETLLHTFRISSDSIIISTSTSKCNLEKPRGEGKLFYSFFTFYSFICWAEEQSDRDLPSMGSLLKCLQHLGLHQAKGTPSGSPELVAGPKHQGHHLPSPRCVRRKLEGKCRWNVIQDVGVLSGGLTTEPRCPPQLFYLHIFLLPVFFLSSDMPKFPLLFPVF